MALLFSATPAETVVSESTDDNGGHQNERLQLLQAAVSATPARLFEECLGIGGRRRDVVVRVINLYVEQRRLGHGSDVIMSITSSRR